jgi:hypothetical protein
VTDDVTFRLFDGPLGEAITWLLAWPAIAFLFTFRRLKTHQMVARLVRSAQPTPTDSRT